MNAINAEDVVISKLFGSVISQFIKTAPSDFKKVK